MDHDEWAVKRDVYRSVFLANNAEASLREMDWRADSPEN